MRVAASLLVVAMIASPGCALRDRYRIKASRLPIPIVFVSRQIPPNGNEYWKEATGCLPGVGPHARFIPAAPGKLQVLHPDGSVRTLVDGSAPGPSSLHLIDVNAPAVSYDATLIVFAGLPQGTYEQSPRGGLNAWRIYTIRPDGTELRQITWPDPLPLDEMRSRFDPPPDIFPRVAETFAGQGHDDTDPVFLPDGRIAFSSTRWPAFAQYSGVRTTNLFVVDGDGRNLHRITSERSGADRPLVDPLTGKIVYARWWRNNRYPTNDLSTRGVDEEPGNRFIQKDGLVIDPDLRLAAYNAQERNGWQAGSINPDGTELLLWSGTKRDQNANHVYGGSFTPDGVLYANYFPMRNMTEASGFGGIRRYQRGAGRYAPVIGTTDWDLDYAVQGTAPSFGVGRGPFAAEPAVLPDGRLVISFTRAYRQDYGLYLVNADGSHLTTLFDPKGTTELRAAAVAPRPQPPIIADRVHNFAAALPPPQDSEPGANGTFTFDALNVYANAPVDSDIVSAIPVGSAASIRFYVDQQRLSQGSDPTGDWPILFAERPLTAQGAVRADDIPADLPLFEQLRSSHEAGYEVPAAGGAFPAVDGYDGHAHVTGLNFGRAGSVVRCVGCHAGHSMMPVPASAEEASWSNLAPGAAVTVSSAREPTMIPALVDRRVHVGDGNRVWITAPNGTDHAWALLVFPAPISVRTVRLYDLPSDATPGSILRVEQASVIVYADAAGSTEVARMRVGPLSDSGVDVSFSDVRGRSLRIVIDDAIGQHHGQPATGLAEVEVIARGESPTRIAAR